MGSPECIDFDRLLAPISDENPSGGNPRADASPDSLYRRLKDTRQRVRHAERQQMRGETPEIDIPAEWRTIYQGGRELLETVAKDYEVTAWFIEAMVREHGFAGLRDGLRLARELGERFWDDLHPGEDEDEGMKLRVAGIQGLFGDDRDGTLIAPIGSLPLTNAGDGSAYSYYDYQMAEDLESVESAEHRARRIEQGALTLEAFENSARATQPEYCDGLIEDIAAAQEQLELLGSMLDERCPPLPDGEQVAPSVANVRNILRSCDQTIRIYYQPAEQVAEGESEGEEVATGEASEGGTGGANVNAEIKSREEAFRILLRVADYFKRTEPHSPLSYALEQSVRWGRLPLPKLWSELIPSDSDREQVFRMVGISQESDSEGD